MEFEWDWAKRAANIAKHGFDFRDAETIFAGRTVVVGTRTVGGEVRERTVGVLDGIHVTIIVTRRGGAIRVISIRRAREDERRAHRSIFG